jgi:16S rRNA (adenine1518-N6/adenine1519-N6)-dimethyltransferase
MPVYVAIVKRAFSQRRKMLGKLLKQDWPEDRLRAALQTANIRPEQRAEEISPDQFARLTLTLKNS